MNKKGSQSFEYSPDEFLADFKAQEIVRNYEYVTSPQGEIKVSGRSFEETFLRTLDYFCQNNPPDLAQKKARIFTLICLHLGENIDAYDTGDLAVNGSQETGALVSEKLLLAIYHYFMTTDLSENPSNGDIVAGVTSILSQR